MQEQYGRTNSTSSSYEKLIIVINIDKINDKKKFQNCSVLFGKGNYGENNKYTDRVL